MQHYEKLWPYSFLQFFVKIIWNCFLTEITYDPRIEKKSHAQESVGWNYLSILKPHVPLQFGNGWVISFNTLWLI